MNALMGLGARVLESNQPALAALSMGYRINPKPWPRILPSFAPCTRRVERRGLETRTPLHLAGYYRSP